MEDVGAIREEISKLEAEVAEKDKIIEKLSSEMESGSTTQVTDSGSSIPKPPVPSQPTSDEAKELLTYDDDPSLGVEAPSLKSLVFLNGDAFDVKGDGKVTVVTWFCNLNKADYVTLTELSDVYQKYKGSCNFVAVSRDHAEADVAKWLKKYNNVFMAEQKSAKGEAGATSRCDFAMAYDPSHSVNSAYKSALKRGVVGVGLVTIVDRDGKIAWNETFVRGVNPTGQFEYQLHAIVEGTELLKNGPRPVVEEEEVEDGGTAPDDLDFLGTGGDGEY